MNMPVIPFQPPWSIRGNAVSAVPVPSPTMVGEPAAISRMPCTLFGIVALVFDEIHVPGVVDSKLGGASLKPGDQSSDGICDHIADLIDWYLKIDEVSDVLT